MAAFCTVQNMEDFLQVTITQAQLAAANRAIAEASASIQNYCHQALVEVVDDIVTYDNIRQTAGLMLPQLPAQSIKSVVENGVTLTATTDYVLGEGGILYRVGWTWARGVQIITVTYTHGYANDAYAGYPEDLIAVCTRVASRAYQAGLNAAAMAGVPGVQSEALGDYSVTYGAGSSSSGDNMLGASAAPMLLRSEKEQLDAYRL
jgi:hypothetical protein